MRVKIDLSKLVEMLTKMPLISRNWRFSLDDQLLITILEIPNL